MFSPEKKHFKLSLDSNLVFITILTHQVYRENLLDIVPAFRFFFHEKKQSIIMFLSKYQSEIRHSSRLIPRTHSYDINTLQSLKENKA
jgi:hypothetical protein